MKFKFALQIPGTEQLLRRARTLIPAGKFKVHSWSHTKLSENSARTMGARGVLFKFPRGYWLAPEYLCPSGKPVAVLMAFTI